MSTATATTTTPVTDPLCLDFVGKQINTGDTVVYAVRQGSSLWLNKLTVTQVYSDRIVGFKSGEAQQRRITIKNIHTCVVVAKAKAA